VLESSGLSWRRDGASPPDVPDDIELPDLRPLHGPPVD
jgi:hypothetical protein